MKILVVKIGAIGDVLMARSIPQIAPAGSEITWLCGQSVAPLVRLFPNVGEVLAIDDRRFLGGGLSGRVSGVLAANAKLLGRRFDLVVTGHSDPRYAWLSRAAFARKHRSFAADRLVRGRFHGHEYARLLHGNEGAQAPAFRYQKLKGPRPGLLKGRRKALLFPGGAKNLLRDNALRRWPLPHYAALATLLKRRGWSVAYSGATSDAWVREGMAPSGALDLIGKFELPETLGLCAEADLVVTHDSGPMHLAAASGTRVLALFGPTAPAEFGAAYENVEVLESEKPLACRPCYDGREFAACSDNRCLSEISPAALLRHLETTRAR